MGPNRRAQERERAAARAAAEAKRAEAERKTIAEAQRDFSCPACGQFGSVDLRTLDRHPGGAISGLIPSLSCRRCSPNAPFARFEMFMAERP